MAVLRESSNDLFWTVYTLFDGSDRLKETMRLIQDYYSLLELENSMEDGDLAFPVTNAAALPASQDDESQVSQNLLEAQGMKIEFKNVSMQYPENSSYALKNVSFVIPAGATVILVGSNGSGKTTTVSLLSRLLDPTAGEILIDDVPVKRYKVQTLRHAQAILRQDYKHFPLSLTENIAIGDPNWFEDEAHAGTNAKATDIAKMTEEKVMRAAKMGDAAEIVEDVRLEYLKKRNGFLAMVNNHELAGTANVLIQEQEKKEAKLEKEKESGGTISGWDIMINPVKTWSGSWLSKDSLLKSMSDGIEKKLQLSGGQWQRLALARLFMKAEGDKIRMICADEPSAALDPRAEHGAFPFRLCSFPSFLCRWF
jgi:ABC-type multidrug transport system fused ATPase/permease subunit